MGPRQPPPPPPPPDCSSLVRQPTWPMGCGLGPARSPIALDGSQSYPYPFPYPYPYPSVRPSVCLSAHPVGLSADLQLRRSVYVGLPSVVRTLQAWLPQSPCRPVVVCLVGFSLCRPSAPVRFPVTLCIMVSAPILLYTDKCLCIFLGRCLRRHYTNALAPSISSSPLADPRCMSKAQDAFQICVPRFMIPRCSPRMTSTLLNFGKDNCLVFVCAPLPSSSNSSQCVWQCRESDSAERHCTLTV